MVFFRKGFSIDLASPQGIKLIAEVPEWSKGQGLGPCDVGLRAFESLPLHTIGFKSIFDFTYLLYLNIYLMSLDGWLYEDTWIYWSALVWKK